MQFIHESGIPQTIISDNAGEETAGRWGELCTKYRIQQKQTVPYSPWANLAEASIRVLKGGIRTHTRRRGSPRRAWCYCGQWTAAIRRLTALNIPLLNERVPEESMKGSTPDISAYAQFDWYEYVRYLDPTADFPHEKSMYGRWLGVAESSTDVMACYILTETGKVIVRKSFWALETDERNSPAVKENLARLDSAIKAKVGDTIKEDEVDKDLIGDLPEAPEGMSMKSLNHTIQGQLRVMLTTTHQRPMTSI